MEITTRRLPYEDPIKLDPCGHITSLQFHELLVKTNQPLKCPKCKNTYTRFDSISIIDAENILYPPNPRILRIREQQAKNAQCCLLAIYVAVAIFPFLIGLGGIGASQR